MRINNVLDELFTRKSNISVTRALKNYNTGISGREISRIVGLTAKNTLSTLTFLEDLGLVNRIRGGREHLFTLNRSSYLVEKAILPLLKTEEEFALEISSMVKSALQRKVEAVIIFGSVARKEETGMSDLDLCIVSDKSDRIEEVVNKLRQQMHEVYNINISPLYISKKDFLKKAKKNQPPVHDIVKEGIVVVGQSMKRILNG